VDKKIDLLIIGLKDSRDYFKIAIKKIEQEKRCKMSSRGKNIEKMTKLAAFLMHSKKLKVKAINLKAETFTPEGRDRPIIVPELTIELIK